MATIVGKDPGAVRRVTCKSCASIIEYTLSETREERVNHDYLGDSDIARVINCPGCGHMIQVKRW
jgi:hypothetical protein